MVYESNFFMFCLPFGFVNCAFKFVSNYAFVANYSS